MKKIELSISSFIKAIFTIIIGVLLIVPTVAFASTGKSNADIVRIRENASTNSEVLGVLDVNESVEVLGENGDWYKVNYNGTIGYVSKEFINVEGVNNNVTQTVTNNESNANENTDIIVNNENIVNTNPVENVTVSKVYKMSEDSKVSILPIITAEKIGEIKKGEKISLVINAGLWAYVENDNIKGWVKLDKLSTEDVIENNESKPVQNDNNNTNANTNVNKVEEPIQNTTATYETKTLYAESAGVNIRSEANTTSDIVDSIPVNTVVKVVGEENGWYKVDVNGKSGYIRKDLLSDKKVEVTSRNNGLDRTAAAKNTSNSQANNAQVNNQTSASNNAQAGSNNVPVSTSGVSGNDVVAYAQQFLGCSYVYGAAGPNSFDCSGFTMYVYKHFGYSLSHSSRVQATQGVPVDINNLQAGDILVFTNDGVNVGHVGLYIGNDKFIHASDSTTGVIISNLHDRWNISKYVGARRIL